MVMPILTYRCGVWAAHKEQKSKIQAMQMNVATEEDRGSILERPNHKWRDSAEAGESRGTGGDEEETGGVERKIGRNGQWEM